MDNRRHYEGRNDDCNGNNDHCRFCSVNYSAWSIIGEKMHEHIHKATSHYDIENGYYPTYKSYSSILFHRGVLFGRLWYEVRCILNYIKKQCKGTIFFSYKIMYTKKKHKNLIFIGIFNILNYLCGRI